MTANNPPPTSLRTQKRALQRQEKKALKKEKKVQGYTSTVREKHKRQIPSINTLADVPHLESVSSALNFSKAEKLVTGEESVQPPSCDQSTSHSLAEDQFHDLSQPENKTDTPDEKFTPEGTDTNPLQTNDDDSTIPIITTYTTTITTTANVPKELTLDKRTSRVSSVCDEVSALVTTSPSDNAKFPQDKDKPLLTPENTLSYSHNERLVEKLLSKVPDSPHLTPQVPPKDWPSIEVKASRSESGAFTVEKSLENKKKHSASKLLRLLKKPKKVIDTSAKEADTTIESSCHDKPKKVKKTWKFWKKTILPS